MVLGYTEQLLRQRSGYEFIHSADMMHCADAHTKRKCRKVGENVRKCMSAFGHSKTS